MSIEGYYSLCRRRLLPIFRYINDRAGKPRSAFVTVPGIGCGQFAGPFRGQLGRRLQEVLEGLLSEYGSSLPNLKCVYFDPYREGQNLRQEINGVSFMVRPLGARGNQAKPQLCRPITYAENGDDFSGCSLYSIVAWGPDVAGQYDPAQGKYQPLQPYANWGEVVDDRMRRGNLRLWNSLAVWRAVELQ